MTLILAIYYLDRAIPVIIIPDDYFDLVCGIASVIMCFISVVTILNYYIL